MGSISESTTRTQGTKLSGFEMRLVRKVKALEEVLFFIPQKRGFLRKVNTRPNLHGFASLVNFPQNKFL